jgi:surface carbohydrate biosynthesis protein
MSSRGSEQRPVLDSAAVAGYKNFELVSTYLVSPTEVINRDLDFQLLLAALYPRRETGFLFGRWHAVGRAALHLKNAIFLGKAFDPFFPTTDLSLYRRLKANGFAVVHLDDEGAVFLGDKEEWRRTLRRRLDPFRLDGDDFVCAWGDWQREVYRAGEPACGSRIRTTGHPRFDLLKPPLRAYYEPKAQSLRQALGDFILLNTNLTTANNGLGMAYSFSTRWGYDPSVPAKADYAVKYWAHSSRILIGFVQLVHRLSREIPHVTIVVRPHPSEDHQFYRTVFVGLDNVRIAHEGSVVPWLMACRLLLHDGCTTGIEAALVGARIINYKSVADARYDLYLPNLFGQRCVTEDEAIDRIRAILSGEDVPRDALPVGEQEHQLLANFGGETFERLFAVLDEACRSLEGRRSACDLLGLLAHEMGAQALQTSKARLLSLSPRRGINQRYTGVKFYGFRKAGIGDRVATIERVTGRRLSWKILSDDLLWVKPA